MCLADGLTWAEGPVLQLRVSGAAGIGGLSLHRSDGHFDPVTRVWSIVGPLEIRNEFGRIIATLSDVSIKTNSDPNAGPTPGGSPSPRGPAGGSVEMAFGVTNGTPAPMNFVVSAGPVAFPPVINGLARASAGMLLTDLNGDGASLIGGQAGGTKSYRASYNGQPSTGTTFATLIDNFSVAAPFGTASMTGGFPPGMFAPIAGPVDDISSQFNFTLSGKDAAAATAVFVVIPEPATAAFLVICIPLVVRRRRL